ncbi:hypothetical protein BOX15_Mlig028377g1 [Macrostomum lignano]|uniref:Uncharacterized protein n=2 Tax=Macrostomum lignano TaxID=282301 RepID=A0A267E595_9PLAT|nr:hypothetical protein BOX15_Mlig028377g1 [Macrostomum lignano]
MNSDNLLALGRLVDQRHLQPALGWRRGFENRLSHLLSQRRLPEQGWSEPELELLIRELALLDMNNANSGSCIGVGEREGRVVCPLVYRRHFGLAHGIGRSGDVTAGQPKAAGSSVINSLTNSLLGDWLRQFGCPKAAKCAVLIPVATGMALCLCLLSLRSSRPSNAKLVLWPRIDQKSCFKAIITAGFTPVPIEPLLDGDQLVTDVTAVRSLIEQHGPDSIVAVMTTTSCFAPRVPDRLADVAKLCDEFGLPHIVNNAYGVQASRCMNLINDASTKGRLDLFVQSCDKNLLMPVGGAVIAGPDAAVVSRVAATYPGRASASPSTDALLTLLHLGRSGFARLLDQRAAAYTRLRDGLASLAGRHSDCVRLLDTGKNPISLALCLRGSGSSSGGGDPERLGAALFRRGCSGARVVAGGEKRVSIEGYEFQGYGAHQTAYPFAPYLNAAAGLGMSETEVDSFLVVLDSLLTKEFRQREIDSRVADADEQGDNDYSKDQLTEDLG